MNPLRIAFAGTPDFALPALNALVGSRHAVVGVLTQPDRPKGRGRQVSASPVKAAATGHSIPVAQPQTLKTEEGRDPLVAWNPDVLVVVAYGLILPQAALDIPRLGCINIHGSLLPRWRGAAPIQRTILAGDAMSGVTIMRLEAGLDTGPMYLRREIALTGRETSGTLHDKLAVEGGAALLEVLEDLNAGRGQLTPQPAEGVTYAAKIEKAEAVIDWSDDAVAIDRKVRAFNPWPIAETRLGNEVLRIHSSRPLPADHAKIPAEYRELAVELLDGNSPPGTLGGLRDDALLVRCGSGVLALTEVQRPGRKPVSARDLANTMPLTGLKLG